MSFVSHRPSILHRPARAEAPKANQESAEAQYDREQAKLQYKQALSQQTQDRLMRSIYTTSTDRTALYQSMKDLDVQKLAIQEAERAKQAALDESYQQSGMYASTANLRSQDVRPWETHVATACMSKAEEDAARRRFAQAVAEENQRLMAEKALQKQADAYMERHYMQQTLGEQSFYNQGIGATCFINTHGRDNYGLRPGTASGSQAPPLKPSSAQAPWATEDNAAVRAVQGVAPQPRQYPWSWQQQ